MERLAAIEETILLFIQNNIRTSWLTPIVKAISFLGDAGWFWILISVMLLIFRQTRRVGLTCALSMVIDAVIVNLIMKNLFARPRPYDTIGLLTSLIGEKSDFSFPSGHSAFSFAVAIVMLLWLPKRYGVPAIVLAGLIALSRLYVGVHYPTDVICGIAVGIICGLCACALYRRADARFEITKKIEKL